MWLAEKTCYNKCIHYYGCSPKKPLWRDIIYKSISMDCINNCIIIHYYSRGVFHKELSRLKVALKFLVACRILRITSLVRSCSGDARYWEVYQWDYALNTGCAWNLSAILSQLNSLWNRPQMHQQKEQKCLHTIHVYTFL